MAPPFKEVEFDILYGEGISREGELIDLATTGEIVEKSGAWLSYGGERIGQGRENAKTFLREHPDVYGSIETKVLAMHEINRGPAPAAAAAADEAAPGPVATAAGSGAVPAGASKPAPRRPGATAPLSS
jgi:recombination protein RecA